MCSMFKMYLRLHTLYEHIYFAIVLKYQRKILTIKHNTVLASLFQAV